MDYFQVTIQTSDTDLQEILIASLDNIGYHGFEQTDTSLSAFISVDEYDENSLNVLIEQYDLKYLKSIIKETNWNQKWESGFEPVSISHPINLLPWVCIRASFHDAMPGISHDVQVTPKMSFGTGHHATTYLMVEEMGRLSFTGKYVIDFGTGTGVLAILAEKLGATNVLAIDYDSWSIENAAENLRANGTRHIKLLQADTIPVQEKGSDILLANINLNIILDHLQAMYDAAANGSVIIFSGLLVEDEITLRVALESYNMSVRELYARDKWLLAVVDKP